MRDNVAARREFRSMHSTLSDTLPAWRIVEPAPAEDLMRFYRDAEAAYDVGWEYLAAINLVETAMGRIRGTSVAGAQGPMQFIPTTWARWGRGDIDDPADSIMAAARYLASNGFARGPRGVANALFEYNNHPAYVRGVTAYAKVMERRPRAFLGLPPVGRLLPDDRGRRGPAGRLRAHEAGPGAALPGRAPAAIGSALVTESSPPAWGGDPSIAWRILLTAVPATPLTVERLAERQSALHQEQGWPAPPPVVSGDPVTLRRDLAEVRDVPLVLGLAGDQVVISAFHAYVDGLGLLEVLAALTGAPVTSSARGVADRPAETGGMVEPAARGGVRASGGGVHRPAIPPSDGDAFAVAAVGGPGPHDSDLVHAAVAAVVAHNTGRGRRSRHVTIGVGAGRPAAPGERLANRSELIRLRDVESAVPLGGRGPPCARLR